MFNERHTSLFLFLFQSILKVFLPLQYSFFLSYSPFRCAVVLLCAVLRSFVAGTVLTLNPIGGIIGGFIGAGAGAGVNEVNKEISLKRTKADHAFAHLKSFQVMQ